MARKKPNPEGEKPKRRGRPKPPADVPDLPDPRLLEGEMRRIVGGFRGPAPDENTSRDKAQVLLEQAYQEPDEARRVELADAALAAWPDCADAYVLLAEHASNRKAAAVLYEKGVAAGERAIGPEMFRQAEGHFWGVLETRPYMRARLGLAMYSGRPPSGRGRPAFAGSAAAQPQRQPGRPLHPGGFPSLPRPRRRPGTAPGLLSRRGVGGLGLHADLARLPPSRRRDRKPPAAQEGGEGK